MSTGLQFSIIIWIIIEWTLRIIALFVVPRNRKPSAATAWLLVIFLVPPLGWLIFAVFGYAKLPKHRRDAQSSLDTYISQSVDMVRSHWQNGDRLVKVRTPSKYISSARLSEGLSHLSVFGGNAIEPLPHYEESIRRIVSDIDAAHSFVYVEYYILALDDTTEPLFNAMAKAIKRGVTVRVLFDAYGFRKFPRCHEMLARMAQDGVQALPMLPFQWPGKHYTRPDLRNHRKLVVIDGVVGYTGSLNMVARNYHRKDDIVYDEMTVRIEGPSVSQLGLVFLNDWYAESGEIPDDASLDAAQPLIPSGSALAQVLPSGPGYEYDNNLKLFNNLFYTAQRTITIVNPYFVPDPSLIIALTSAAQRGVTVTLINSEVRDQWMVAHAQRSYYEEMLRAGVNIYLYKKPTLLHSKFTLIDDDACFVGSSNMDIRSLELDQELTLIVYDKAFVSAMQAITDGYISNSSQIDKDEWFARPPRKQLLDNLARLNSSVQ